MDNNTIDPATIVRPSPKDGLGSTRVTSDNLSTEVKPRKVDGSEGLNSKYEVPSTNALMAEKRLAASNNLAICALYCCALKRAVNCLEVSRVIFCQALLPCT